MKRIICLLLTVFMSISVFTGCQSTKKDDGKLKIVTTIFSAYDWTREILGDRLNDVDLTYLLDNGTDLHNYQPTNGDLRSIKKSDLFIYVGGESDVWVANTLKGNDDINGLNMMDVLKDSLLEEELVEGMEETEEEGEEEEETEYDEHIWLSLSNASIICDAICDQLCKIDSEFADTYKENNKTYKMKLLNLFSEYSDVVDNAETKTILVADRFPFRYLADDFGIKYYAAFKGCSSEVNATLKNKTLLVKKLVSENLSAVIVLEGSDKKLAEAIINASNLKNIDILELNSMQTETLSNGNKATYLSIAESNLKVLKKALKTRG